MGGLEESDPGRESSINTSREERERLACSENCKRVRMVGVQYAVRMAREESGEVGAASGGGDLVHRGAVSWLLIQVIWWETGPLGLPSWFCPVGVGQSLTSLGLRPSLWREAVALWSHICFCFHFVGSRFLPCSSPRGCVSPSEAPSARSSRVPSVMATCVLGFGDNCWAGSRFTSGLSFWSSSTFNFMFHKREKSIWSPLKVVYFAHCFLRRLIRLAISRKWTWKPLFVHSCKRMECSLCISMLHWFSSGGPDPLKCPFPNLCAWPAPTSTSMISFQVSIGAFPTACRKDSVHLPFQWSLPTPLPEHLTHPPALVKVHISPGWLGAPQEWWPHLLRLCIASAWPTSGKC